MSGEPCSECDGYETVIVGGEEIHCQTCSLRAEVDRLRAAGDALAVRHRKTFFLDGAFDAELRQWEAARRG